MVHKLFISCIVLGLACSMAALPIQPAVFAQGNMIQGLTHYALTVYSGPERSSSIIGVLNPQAKVILESRNSDTSWVLGRSTDGAVRGWMEYRYLELPDDANASKLLLSNEHMFVESVNRASTWPATVSLDDYPVVPVNMGRAREIFERGLFRGMDMHTLSKVGDCISDNRYFLSPFGWNQYELGGYPQLQGVIDHFAKSLAQDSLAAYDGLVTSAVLNPVFANPLACLPGETPLRCEYRVHKSSVAIIMFGAQDLLFTSAEDFDHNLRRITHETIEAGVVPVLSTFPGNTSMWDKSLQFNQIVVQVALDYDVPLMNLWLALEDLPNHGLDSDGRHLSLPLTSSGDLTGNNLQRGYPMRNLVTLQTLDAVLHRVIRS